VATGKFMCVGKFQKVVRLGLKSERSRREDRGADGVRSGEGVSSLLVNIKIRFI